MLSNMALMVRITSAVWLGYVYGWHALAALFFWQWGVILENTAKKMRSKANA